MVREVRLLLPTELKFLIDGRPHSRKQGQKKDETVSKPRRLKPKHKE